MGRGDKKTKRGKIFMGSFGNTRKRVSAGYVKPKAEEVPAEPVKTEEPKKKAPKKKEK
jgi:30S ribosomal protein S31